MFHNNPGGRQDNQNKENTDKLDNQEKQNSDEYESQEKQEEYSSEGEYHTNESGELAKRRKLVEDSSIRFMGEMEELYELIGTNDHASPNTVTNILCEESFALNIDKESGKEIKFKVEEFEAFHDHCFETPLLAICHVASQHNPNFTDDKLQEHITKLISLGADVNARDEEGNTPILLLAGSVKEYKLFLGSIKILIGHGAVLNDVNNEKKTVLHRAFELNNFPLALELYKLGAKVFLDENDHSFVMECEDKDAEELLDEDLIHNLKVYFLLSNCPEEKDELYSALRGDMPKHPMQKVAYMVQLIKENPIISERSYRLIMSQHGYEDVLHALFKVFNKKLKNRDLTPTTFGQSAADNTSSLKETVQSEIPEDKVLPTKN